MNRNIIARQNTNISVGEFYNRGSNSCFYFKTQKTCTKYTCYPRPSYVQISTIRKAIRDYQCCSHGFRAGNIQRTG